jgi:hypothetical protein
MIWFFSPLTLTSTPSLRPNQIFTWARMRGKPLRTIAQEVPKAKRRQPAITEVLATTETTSSTSSDEDDSSWAARRLLWAQ